MGVTSGKGGKGGKAGKGWRLAVVIWLLVALAGAVVGQPVGTATSEVLTTRVWESGTGQIYDQGDTPMCVGYAMRAWLDSGPQPYMKETPTAQRIYWQSHDVYDSILNYPDYGGTTVQGAVAYLQAEGLIGVTGWSTDTLVLEQFILHDGPVVTAQPWTGTMFEPGEDGVLSPGPDEFIGGYHSVEYYGADLGDVADPSDDTLYGQNSWGAEWGHGGRFSIKRVDLQILLDRWKYSAGAMPQKGGGRGPDVFLGSGL